MFVLEACDRLVGTDDRCMSMPASNAKRKPGFKGKSQETPAWL
jgi:hypothetical protein